MIYVAGGLAALGLIGGLLFLVGRGAERRDHARRHRRGIRAGDGVAGGGAGYGAFGADMADGGGCDSGGGGGCD